VSAVPAGIDEISKGAISMKLWHVISIALVAALSPTLAAAERARNCNDAIANCQTEGSRHPNILEKCAAAGAQCRKTGVFVGPITGRKWYLPNR
jgi:hypothetical protein